MDYKKIIGELHYRFKYSNWFIKAVLKDDKIILHIANDPLFEKHIVEQIMSHYDCEYEIVIVNRIVSSK